MHKADANMRDRPGPRSLKTYAYQGQRVPQTTCTFTTIRLTRAPPPALPANPPLTSYIATFGSLDAEQREDVKTKLLALGVESFNSCFGVDVTLVVNADTPAATEHAKYFVSKHVIVMTPAS